MEYFVRIQVDVPVSSPQEVLDVPAISHTAARMIRDGEGWRWLVDEQGCPIDKIDSFPPFKDGDMCGVLPGIDRSWEIEETGDGFDVWFDGCVHGGTFSSYAEAITAIDPENRGR